MFSFWARSMRADGVALNQGSMARGDVDLVAQTEIQRQLGDSRDWRPAGTERWDDLLRQSRGA